MEAGSVDDDRDEKNPEQQEPDPPWKDGEGQSQQSHQVRISMTGISTTANTACAKVMGVCLSPRAVGSLSGRVPGKAKRPSPGQG